VNALKSFRATTSLRAGERLSDAGFRRLRVRLLLDGCKWDPQVGDTNTLAQFPLVLAESAWKTLASLAEKLTAETLLAEQEICGRPDLLKELGLPRKIKAVMKDAAESTPVAARVMRFDFHPTTEGWRLSEVNSDVPGGYCESSLFTALMAEHYDGLSVSGDPGKAVADTLVKSAGEGGKVLLLTAPGYMEDHQVVAYLASLLGERGCVTQCAKPEQIEWREGEAYLAGKWDAVVRFHQAEWLAQLPERCDWGAFFRGGKTPVMNPGVAVISESKRFPLLWDSLQSPMNIWRRLLPETKDVREVSWCKDDNWLVKGTFCNTGDAVFGREQQVGREWRRAKWRVGFFPQEWVAQRRFESVPLETPDGLKHVCLGVYTVNGKAAGIYARLATKPLIDFAAVDAAVLIKEDE
jgi:glutathionylspermidine synthase